MATRLDWMDVDDPDGYAYGVSTVHFNMHIAGLVQEIDKSFSYVQYIGFGDRSRNTREAAQLAEEDRVRG